MTGHTTRSPELLRAAAPYAFLIGFSLLFFWPVWLLGYTYPTGGGDLWGQLLPVWSYVARFVRRGVLPLWSTQLMAGDPIIGEPQYGLLNPLNWWLFLLGTTPRWLVLARGLLPLVLAGWGIFTYLRTSSQWRLRTTSALVGAVAYMVSDPFITHLGHPQINDAMAWLPWAFLAVDALIDRARFRLWPSLVFSCVVLAGHYQTAMFTATAAGLYAPWRLACVGGRQAKLVGRLALSALCATALAMPAVLPALERYPFTERAILQLEPWRGYQWPLSMAIDLVAPGFHGRGVEGFWAPWARVEGAYVGAVGLSLALLGVIAGPKRFRTWFFVLLGALGVLYALGYDGPLYPVLSRVDFIARMHKTARAIFLVAYSMSVMAAAGLEALLAGRRRLSHIWGLVVVVGALVLVLGARPLASAVPIDRRAAAVGSLLVGAAAIGGGATLSRPLLRGSPLAKALLVLLICGELVLTGTWVELEPGGADAHRAVVDYLRGDPNWYRVDVDSAARGLLSPPVLVAAGFDVPQTSGNPMELYSYSQFYWAVPTKGAPSYQVLGCKYIIVPKGALPGGDGIWPVFTEAPQVDVHLNTNALPRVWLVYNTAPVSSIEHAYDIVFSQDFEPVSIATVEGGPSLASSGRGTLEVVAYGGNRADFFVRSSEDGLLVLSDIHYPGWRAKLDSRPADILKVNGIFRGIVVPAGEHRVTMRYAPGSWRLGLGVAAAGALALVYTSLGWSDRRALAAWGPAPKPADGSGPD